jgi:multicomponent Na+:H+ antiporter subunit E
MAFQILLNFFLAFLWMLMQVSFTTPTFIIGYMLGMFIILSMRRFFTSRFYMSRVWAIIKLFFLFMKELIMANYEVVKVVIKPKLNIEPGIFAMPIDLTSNWEITLLSNLITLTPGTFVIDVSDDKKILYVHAMDVPDAEAAIDGIKNSFEKAIMEVSR